MRSATKRPDTRTPNVVDHLWSATETRCLKLSASLKQIRVAVFVCMVYSNVVAMTVVCLDMEGVVIPEIWHHVAQQSGVKALKLTTRDVPDYDQLMHKRLELLHRHHLTLADIQKIIATIDPLAGAVEFLRTLRRTRPLILLSDTFTQFIEPLVAKLEWPTIFCNQLVVDAHGVIKDYRLRQKDGKRHAVRALQSIGYRVFAAGDSYNDLTMIECAERGALFRPPDSIAAQYPDIIVCTTYRELLAAIENDT